MNYLFLWYGTNDNAHVDFHDTEAEAIKDMQETADGYLEAGELPPNLDDWCVAKITHRAERKDIPLDGTVVKVEAA